MNQADYAVWESPQLRVEYPLALFHEIDFTVNEGYRRIPHGGIETGGLLFGERTGSVVQIQAFRVIECEHAFGPSFQLSDRDVERVEQQLAGYQTDAELARMVPLGWFAAHTRSELVMNDREAEVFKRLFPESGALLLLVKPEKFKPTRFLFLPRQADGAEERDGADATFILPLPGRAARAARPRRDATPTADGPEQFSPAAPAKMPPEPVALDAMPFGAPPEKPRVSEEAWMADAPPAEPQPEAAPQRPSVLFEPITFPLPSPPQPIYSVPPAPPTQPVPSASLPLTRSPMRGPEEPAPGPERVRRAETSWIRDAAPAASSNVFTSTPLRNERAELRQQRQRSGAAPTASAWGTLHWVLLGLTLACAAVVAWGAYLRLQPIAVPLSVVPRTTSLAVSWPSSVTAEAETAAISVDGGVPQPLAASDRVSGTTTVAMPSGNASVKIELTAHRWLHDARGIVRWVPAPPPAPVAPRATASRVTPLRRANPAPAFEPAAAAP